MSAPAKERSQYPYSPAPSPHSPRDPRWASARLFAGTVVVLAAAAFLLMEISLRLLSAVAGEPLRSFVREAARIPYSNTRTVPGNVSIMLPKLDRADVLVVGDSFPFGTYERTEDTFPSLLGEATGLAVANLAVGSQSPPQYNRMLEVGARYSPRLVLYCVFANDFLYVPEPKPLPLSADNTYRHLPGDEALFRDDETFRERARRGVRTLTNLSLGLQILKIFQQVRPGFRMIPWRQGKNFYLMPEKRYWSGISWDNPEVRKGVETNLDLIRHAFRFSDSVLNARFLVLLQPSKEMVYGPLTGDLKDRVYDDSWHATYRELGRRLESDGIPYLDLTPALREAAEQGRALYHAIDGHFNEEGHREAAARLLHFLKD